MGLKDLFTDIQKSSAKANGENPNYTIDKVPQVARVPAVKSIGSTRRVRKSFTARLADYESGSHIAKERVRSDDPRPVDSKAPEPIEEPKKKKSLVDRVKEKVIDRTKNAAVKESKKYLEKDKASNKGSLSRTGEAVSLFADLFGD